MSYDLFMKPRVGQVDRERFADYFANRPHYQTEGNQAWYRNADTGTYFVFEYSDDVVSNAPDDEDAVKYPLSFNINYFRPSYFGKEAEPEVHAFIRTLDLLVEDPQIDGTGIGEYASDKFLSGWAKGNEFGYQAVLKQNRSEKSYTLPAAEVERIWLWNLERPGRQAELGESHFVPRIMFLDFDGTARSAAVWPDAIPCLIPQVEYFIVDRDELAPRRFFRKQTDSLLVTWRAIEAIIRAHSSTAERPGFLLNYQSPPSDVVEFIRNLPSRPRELKGISADSVLDAELVAKYAV